MVRCVGIFLIVSPEYTAFQGVFFDTLSSIIFYTQYYHLFYYKQKKEGRFIFKHLRTRERTNKRGPNHILYIRKSMFTEIHTYTYVFHKQYTCVVARQGNGETLLTQRSIDRGRAKLIRNSNYSTPLTTRIIFISSAMFHMWQI